MSSIHISRTLDMEPEQIRELAVDMGEQLSRDFGVYVRWNGDHARISGTGVSGEFLIEDQTITIKVRLGFLLMPMKGPIEQGITAQLDSLA